MERLTIVRPGGLGDSLLLAPALAELRRDPEVRVQVVGLPSRLEPLLRAGLADEISSLDSWLQRMDASRLAPNAEHHRIVSFFPLPDFLQGLDHVAVHPAFPDDRSEVHAAEHLAGCLGVTAPLPVISPVKGLVRKITDRERPRLWIHPGAGGRSKRWPLESFLRVAVEVRDKGANTVRFLIGEAELDLESPVRREGFEVVGHESPLAVANAFREGDCLLGNDSGIAHLAGLCGLLTLAVFGPTSPVLWRPWGERVRVLQGDGGSPWPSPETVLRVWKEEIGKQV